jgi:pimeloyl-ACP methyl ester carboxylesterase
MKRNLLLLLIIFFAKAVLSQNTENTLNVKQMNPYEILKTKSRLPRLQIAITHQLPSVASCDYPVLFLHGSSFPAALAFGFRMAGYSWMDYLSERNYDVYALDFLGYGYSDRYPEMSHRSPIGKPLGRASEVYLDVNKAVDLILARTGKKKVYLIAHSWGGTVAALYATRFPNKVAKLILFAALTPRNNMPAHKASNHHRYEVMTPEQRVNAMRELTPQGKDCQLEAEVLSGWAQTWLHSDPLSVILKADSVRFPAGYASDVQDLMQGKQVYRPEDLRVPVLLIRGQWDEYPNNDDEKKLFASLQNTPSKKYVVIEKGTHVMHLEKSRQQLYEETLGFLQSNYRKNAQAE